MRRKWNEDDCSEFLCYFYRRIPGMIQRFQYSGSPFEALLKVTLRFQMKSFALELKKRRIEAKVLASRDFWDRTIEQAYSLPEEEEEEDSKPTQISLRLRERLGLNDQGLIIDKSMRRKLLLLVLREADRVSESLLVHLLTLTGYERSWVTEKIEMVKTLSFQLEGRRNTFRHRRNLMLFNIYCLQEELLETPDPVERQILLDKLARERKSLLKAENGLRRVPQSPTHLQLAEILEMPRGTVNSGLHSICRLLEADEP